MRAVSRNRLIQTEVIKAALVFNAHPTVSPAVSPSFSSTDQTGDSGNGHATLTVFPASTGLPFIPSSRIRVFSLHEGGAVIDDGKGVRPEFQTLTLLPSKSCCVWATQPGGGHQGSPMELWMI